MCLMIYYEINYLSEQLIYTKRLNQIHFYFYIYKILSTNLNQYNHKFPHVFLNLFNKVAYKPTI